MKSFATAIILTVFVCFSPALGSTKTTTPARESYYRIVHENTDDFCVGRSSSSVVFCASPVSTPRLCDNTPVNFTSKMIVLQGPDGKCIGSMDGAFDSDAHFDRSKILQRLPLRYGVLEFCKAFYLDGKWLELGGDNRNGLFRAAKPPQPLTSTYRMKSEPWVRFNLSSKPNYLCVGRNGSEEAFCSSNPSVRANCAGSSFINFDYRHVVKNRTLDKCSLTLRGYYDMLVDVKTRAELDRLPVYDKHEGESCVSYGIVDGAQENPCSNDGRRCRP